MKKTLMILMLCGFNLAIASDKNSFTRKFERKMAAASSNLNFGKKVSAHITMEITSDGKARVLNLKCDQQKEAEKLKQEIEKMQFTDTTCTGTHVLQLNISPQQ